MKRITSLFILLMVSLLGVTVMAQSLDIQGKFIKSVGSPVLTPGNINESKYYILYNTGRNWYPYGMLRHPAFTFRIPIPPPPHSHTRQALKSPIVTER